jgi:glycosyltransferase involved in cell wall biosynthesis
MRTVEPNVHVVSLGVPADMPASDVDIAYRRCVASLGASTERPLLWVYSPASVRAARDLDASLVVYDCVADHAARSEATPDLRAAEADLLARADLVFTAGTSLFEAKRSQNVSTYPLPSSVDAEHFARGASARERGDHRDASELAGIAGPRIGFLGPIDDRVDLALVDRLAAARPDVQIVLLGALAGVTTWDLPDRPNVHWLGAKSYDELPEHVGSWDLAVIPFRHDAATRRSEPSGLLAGLAANKAVVSTPIDEVVPYAERGLVKVVHADRFVAGVDEALRDARDVVATTVPRLACQDILARTSWDRTVQAMRRLVDEAVMSRELAARRRGSSERLLRSA